MDIKMKITLKDGSVKEYDKAMSVYEIAQDLSEGLARVAFAGEVEGEVVDLSLIHISHQCGGSQSHSHRVSGTDPEDFIKDRLKE